MILEWRPWIAPVVMAALAVWLGGAALRRLGSARADLPARAAAGLVLLHCWLLVLDRLGVPWTLPTVLAPALVALLLDRWGGTGPPRKNVPPREKGPPREGEGPGGWQWSDWVAAGAVAVFAWSALSLHSMAPDFVYHWGVKARRFFEAGGVDWTFLGGHDVGYLHPDYPLLLPDLGAASAILGGGWLEGPQMLWSVGFLVLLILQLRTEIGALALRPRIAGLGLAAAAVALAAFSVGHLQAGAGELPLALALLALCGAVRRSPEVSSWTVGAWAALAAAVKIEGAPLALFAVALVIARAVASAGAWAPSALLASARRWTGAWLPPLLVGGWWTFEITARGLLQPQNAGWPSAERIAATFDAIPRALSLPTWTGMAWLVLLLPLMLGERRLRWFVAPALLQMVFYLLTYFGGEQGTEFWVLSSFPRLVFHVMPVVLVGLVALADRWDEREKTGSPARESLRSDLPGRNPD